MKTPILLAAAAALLIVDHAAQAASLERGLSSSEAARQSSDHGATDRSITEAIVVLVVLTLLTIVTGALLGRVAVEREVAREHSDATAETLQQSIARSSLLDGPPLKHFLDRGENRQIICHPI